MPADVLETVRRIRAVHVVVPARNEAQTLPATLTALERARERLLALRPEIRVDVTVALDRCEDNSAGIVRAHRRVGWIQLGAGDVGRARAVGVAWARAGSPVEPGAAWIANTDADSQVPPDWLTAHVAHAERGVDLLLGLVQPVGPEMSQERLRGWNARHDLTDGHPHVFGANLGVHAAAYRAVGGFRPMRAHEDADLVDRVRRAAFTWHATADAAVATSARTVGRAAHGFAAALRALPASAGPWVAPAPQQHRPREQPTRRTG